MNKKGVALLQALIMANLIALTAAAFLILALGGYTSVTQIEKSVDYRGVAEAALALAYQDLECFDPDFNGTWTACVGGVPPPHCEYDASNCSILPVCLAGQCAKVGGGCALSGTTIPPAITVEYRITLSGGSSVCVPTTFTFDSSSYSISATPPEFN